MICLLRSTLLKQRISTNKAKEICGDFAYDLAILQDQGTIEVGQKKYRPIICFDGLNSKLIHDTDKNCQLHYYAFGNKDEAFETSSKP